MVAADAVEMLGSEFDRQPTVFRDARCISLDNTAAAYPSCFLN